MRRTCTGWPWKRSVPAGSRWHGVGDEGALFRAIAQYDATRTAWVTGTAGSPAPPGYRHRRVTGTAGLPAPPGLPGTAGRFGSLTQADRLYGDEFDVNVGGLG